MAVFSGPEIVNDGLILHLDAANSRSYSGSGTIWSDISSNDNNGTLINSPDYLDNGFRFSNDSTGVTGGYMTIPDSASLNNLTSFTLSFCIYSLGTQNSNGASVFSKVVEGVSGFDVGPVSYGIRVNYWDGTSWTWSSNAVSLEHNQFIIYDYVYTGTDLIIYKNGVEILNNPITIVWDNTSTVWVGRRNGHLRRYLYGSILYERLYNKALTSTEIQQNFNAMRGRYGI